MSLDGYISGPQGESDWIVMDPDIDFSATMAEFDTYLIGRKTFEALRRMGSTVKSTPGTQNIVFSRTLRQPDYPHVIVSDNAEHFVQDLRQKPGKDIAITWSLNYIRATESAHFKHSFLIFPTLANQVAGGSAVVFRLEGKICHAHAAEEILFA